MQSFQQDCGELALAKFRRGEVGRRGLMAGLAALGLGTDLVPREAGAQGRQLVMVNWGGIANEAFGRFYGEPFAAAKQGARLVQDSTGPSAARIRSMVESGRVTWDICDSSAISAFLPGGMNLLNRVDDSVVNRDDVIAPTVALEHGAAPYSFSNLLVYGSAGSPMAPRRAGRISGICGASRARGCCGATRPVRWMRRRWRWGRTRRTSTRSISALPWRRCARSAATPSSGPAARNPSSSSAPERP